MFIIYRITNKVNGKIYIGLTKQDLIQRLKCHRYKRTTLISQKIKEYGYENFLIEQIDVADTLQEASKKEIFWIEKLNSFVDNGKGYNMTRGGQSYIPVIGYYKMSQESKDKLRLDRLGIPRPKEMCEKLSAYKKIICNTKEGKEKMKLMRRKQIENGSWEITKQKIIEGLAKKWEITTKAGDKFIIVNLAEFCRTHELNESYMRNIALGLNRGKWNKGFHCEQYKGQG